MMGKTALDFVKEKMFELAKSESTSAGGWEAVEDMARLKINVDYTTYFILALTEYLNGLPYPTTNDKAE